MCSTRGNKVHLRSNEEEIKPRNDAQILLMCGKVSYNVRDMCACRAFQM